MEPRDLPPYHSEPISDDWSTSRIEEWARKQALAKAKVSSGLDATVPKPGEKQTTDQDVIDFFKRLATRLGYKYGEDYALVLSIGDSTDNAQYYSILIAIVDFLHHILRLALGKNRMTLREYVMARNALMVAGLPSTGFSRFPELTEEMLLRLSHEEEDYRSAVHTLRDTVSQFEEEGREEDAERLRRAIQVVTGGQCDDEDTQPTTTTTDSFSPLKFKLPPTEVRSILMKTIDEFQRFVNLSVEGETHMARAEQLTKEWYGIEKGLDRGFAVLDIIRRKDGETQEEYGVRFNSFVSKLMADLSRALGRFHGYHRLGFHSAGIGEIMPIGFVPQKEEMMTIDQDGTAKSILAVTGYTEKLIEKANKDR